MSESENEALVTKENMLRGKVLLEEKFKSLPSKQEKVLKKPNKILGVTISNSKQELQNEQRLVKGEVTMCVGSDSKVDTITIAHSLYLRD